MESRQKIEFFRTKMQEIVSTEVFFYAPPSSSSSSLPLLSHGLFVVVILIWTSMECGPNNLGKMMLVLLTEAFPPLNT